MGTIDRLGARGEGVARSPAGLIFVPYALAGETIAADVDGSRGTLVEVLTPSPHRIAPFCRYFSRCGGCAVQTLAADSYARWKRDLVASALRRPAHRFGPRRCAWCGAAPRNLSRAHAQGQPAVGFTRRERDR
jgi:23S rRNA (uracil1939-C5)-methyltransferase